MACLDLKYTERDKPSATPQLITVQERDELAKEIEEKTRELIAKDQQIALRDQEIAAKTQELLAQSKLIERKDQEIQRLGMELHELHQSNSSTAYTSMQVVLHKTENPWVRFSARIEVGNGDLDNQELFRKFKGILNKVTPQKFQTLTEQALELEIDSEEKLMGCIDMIYTNAIHFPKYGIAYANLCKVLSPIKVDRVMPGGKSKSIYFRRTLLTKCQQEFEKDVRDDEDIKKLQKAIKEAETPEAKKLLQEEIEVAQTEFCKRYLGNIQFIGELFKLKMLSETIMHECILRLLRSSSNEETLECFVRLITLTGKDLDHPHAKARIDNYFNRIADMIEKGNIPYRIKFMLQDIQELRQYDWTPRVRQDNQLKTIDQIRADAELEAAKELEMIQKHMVLKLTGGAGGIHGLKQDDWQIKGDRRDKESEIEREKFDPKRILALSRRKDTGSHRKLL